ncbi:MAG: hypothetical protein M0Z46_12640 [Actinomycetota bacterium]|nr:hypothetical protein [Actinomycetota bacterium]
MKLATGPYTLHGGGHISISLPAATLLVRAVIIGNLTPAAVTVTIGGQTSHLLPASANLFTLSSGAQGIVVTSLGTATQSGTITAEWLTPATVPPSGYPFGGAVTNLTLGPDASVKITGPVTLAAGSTVDLASGTSVSISSGTVDLGSGSTVKIETAVIVSGATASGQSAPTFVGRTVSASSTAFLSGNFSSSAGTLVPNPGPGKFIELHAFAVTNKAQPYTVILSRSTAATGKFAAVGAWTFQGATLPATSGVYIVTAPNTALDLQLNYTIRT